MKYIPILLLFFVLSCKTQDKQVSKIQVNIDTLSGDIVAYQSKDVKTDNNRYEAILRSIEYSKHNKVLYNEKEYPMEKADSIINILGDDCTVNIITDTIKNVIYFKIERINKD